ncbi:MAG: 6-phosphofructokinase [Planctomycetes bacterium]|nr:6-phosphofructokinase [Planctomycetota bacterium]
MTKEPIAKVALLVGGGPAPGINGVISAVTLEAVNNGIQVFGIRDGFKHLVTGSKEAVRTLTREDVHLLHLRGGSFLGTSRSNPTKSPEDMKNVLGVFRSLEIDALVTIGGDDTAYSASRVYKEAAGAIRVAHVPKTIDNDLPLPGSTPTFGFETARQLGTEIVRNLFEDARTTSRWYLIVSMGRAAGHLALGIGKAAAATLTVIPEEFPGREVTLDELCDIIIGSIIKRESLGLHYGVVVLAEGLIAAIGEKGLAAAIESGQLGRYGRVARDPHGHLRLGEIEFGRMIRDHLSDRLQPLGLKTAFIDKDLGYELRSADPIPFDAEYTRDLGYGAVKFLRSERAGKEGAIISYVEGRMVLLPFDEMINPATQRMKTRRVDVSGESYECARRYMFRLEKGDFTSPERLAKLAAKVKMTPEEFRTRFEYLTARDAS